MIVVREGVLQADAADRREQVLPADRAEQVGEAGDRDRQHDEVEARAAYLAPDLAQVRVAQKEREQGDRKQRDER